MRNILPLLVGLLCACSKLDYHADAKAKTEDINYLTFGGSSAIDSAGGTRITQNHNKTAGQFFQTAATGLTVGFSYLTQKAQELTTQLANANLTSLEKAKVQADLQKTLAQIAATTESERIAKTLTH